MNNTPENNQISILMDFVADIFLADVIEPSLRVKAGQILVEIGGVSHEQLYHALSRELDKDENH